MTTTSSVTHFEVMSCGCTGRSPRRHRRRRHSSDDGEPSHPSGDSRPSGDSGGVFSACSGVGCSSRKPHRRRHKKKKQCCCPILDTCCPDILTFWSTGVSGKTLRPIWWSTGVASTCCEPGPYVNGQTGVAGFSGYPYPDH